MKRVSRIAAGLAMVVLSTACSARAPESATNPAARYAPPITLPAPSLRGGMPLVESLATRRSERSFNATVLSEAQLGQLLWAAQGMTSRDGKRTAPSAGGLYPLEMYAVVRNQLWHYLPLGHRVEIRTVFGSRSDLQSAALNQSAVGDAPQVLVIALAYRRATAKYASRGRAYADMEAGHVAQNVLLQATALGLAAVPIGGIDPSRCAAVLGLPPDQTVSYLIPVGVPR